MEDAEAILGMFGLIFYAIGRTDQSIMTTANVDHDPNDINGGGLRRVIDHCGNRELGYRQLSIVRADREPSYRFYEGANAASKIPIRVSNGLETLDSTGSKSCVVLWLSANEIRELFKSSANFQLEPSSLVIVYVGDETAAGAISHEDMRRGGYSLWRTKYVHKLIIAVNGSLIFFDPFGARSSGTLRKLAESGDFESLEFRDDFSGYGIGVTVFPYLTARKAEDGSYVGYEGNAMREVIRGMNVTLREIHEPPEEFGWVNGDGTATGSLGRIAYHKSDLAFNGFFVKNYGIGNVESSTTLGADQICPIVPKRGKIPDYLLIVTIFSPFSWAVIFAGNSFLALSKLALKRAVSHPLTEREKNSSSKYERANRPRNTLKIVQRFAGSWIFLCFYPAVTEARWFGERVHLVLGLLFSVVIGGCFTSKLASTFSKPVYSKNIDTLEELDKSGLKILTNYRNLLNDVFVDEEFPSETLQSLHKKLKLENLTEIGRRVHSEKDAAFLEREYSIVLESNFTAKLHLVPDCPRKYHLAYPIAKGSPFKRRLDTLIGRLNFSGIYLKWFKDMAKRAELEEKEKPVVIRSQHLLMPFFILFSGLAMATIVFCLERRGAGGLEPFRNEIEAKMMK